MKQFIYLIILTLILTTLSCSQEKKLVRKAANAVERSDFDLAIRYYDQALKRDSNSYFANAGKGVVLSEYVGRHDLAIPYLEKALKKHPEKTTMKINNDLGKSYHYIGNYPRALYFYGQTAKYNKIGSPDYDQFLNKRVADCKYALDHPQVAPPEEQQIKNAGSAINTANPEYGAVYTRNQLLFTSKRKDDEKEKKNGVDGRYFDGMYASANKNGILTPPRRYTVPDVKPKASFNEPHESVVSISPDGNTLYIFRASQIYETDLNDSTQSAHKLPNEINFSYLQSHVTLSADGNTMIFASESERGVGGLDLYKSIKNEKGKWSDAEQLSSLNSIFNEDSPYLNKDGVLFFSSNGLPGYGGYDVYKTRLVNNQWQEPTNLGQPINSPGDDIYFMLSGNTSNGYYTSVRMGGYGDMDIYKVHYLLTDVPQCQPNEPSFAINAAVDVTNSMRYNISVSTPDAYAAKVRSYSWKLNGEPLAQTSDTFLHTFASTGLYTLTVKAVAYCDTCPSLVALCSEKVLELGTPIFATTDTLNSTKDVAVNTHRPSVKPKKTNTPKDLPTRQTVLNDAQLAELGWNPTEAHFDYNGSEIQEEAKTMLLQNLNILKTNKNLSVNINGYADSRGGEAYNQALSLKRATAIKNYLIHNGIPKSRILSIRGYGESQPVNGCVDGVECSEAEHQLNRRVQFDVIQLIKTPADISFN